MNVSSSKPSKRQKREQQQKQKQNNVLSADQQRTLDEINALDDNYSKLPLRKKLWCISKYKELTSSKTICRDDNGFTKFKVLLYNESQTEFVNEQSNGNPAIVLKKSFGAFKNDISRLESPQKLLQSQRKNLEDLSIEYRDHCMALMCQENIKEMIVECYGNNKNAPRKIVCAGVPDNVWQRYHPNNDATKERVFYPATLEHDNSKKHCFAHIIDENGRWVYRPGMPDRNKHKYDPKNANHSVNSQVSRPQSQQSSLHMQSMSLLGSQNNHVNENQNQNDNGNDNHNDNMNFNDNNFDDASNVFSFIPSFDSALVGNDHNNHHALNRAESGQQNQNDDDQKEDASQFRKLSTIFMDVVKKQVFNSSFDSLLMSCIYGNDSQLTCFAIISSWIQQNLDVIKADPRMPHCNSDILKLLEYFEKLDNDEITAFLKHFMLLRAMYNDSASKVWKYSLKYIAYHDETDRVTRQYLRNATFSDSEIDENDDEIDVQDDQYTTEEDDDE